MHQQLTDDVIEDGFQFYTTFFNAPPAIKVRIHETASPLGLPTQSRQALLHGFIGIGVLGLIAKLHAWTDSAIWFDGSSLGKASSVLYFHLLICHFLAAYIFAIAVYLAVTIPALRTIVTPAEVDTREDRIEAMRVLAAGNTIMMVILGAILVLQVSCQLLKPIVRRRFVWFGLFFRRRLFSSHLLCLSCHFSPLTFYQAGQEYARRMELKELAAEKTGKEKQSDEKEKKE